MPRSLTVVPALFFVALATAACGGKVEDPLGHSSSGQEGRSGTSGSSGAGTMAGSGGSASSSDSCTASQMGGGGGGVAGGACTQVFESATCGATTYSVNCTCPGPCDCVVNGKTVDTAPTDSCSGGMCSPPDDAWKACRFPAVAGMP